MDGSLYNTFAEIEREHWWFQGATAHPGRRPGQEA
jgi:hypothetical protein